MKIGFGIFCVLLATLLATATAGAAVVPPGNSAATQYAETLPGAGGEETTRRPGYKGHGNGDSGASGPATEAPAAVPAETAAELRKLGPEGAAALELAETGAPRGGAKPEQGDKEKGSAAPAGGAGPSDPGSGSNGSSGLGEVLGRATGTSTSGLGFLQPLLIAAALIAAGAYALRRRRPRTGTGSERW